MIEKGDGNRDQKEVSSGLLPHETQSLILFQNQRQRSNLRQMIAYCENQIECRRHLILEVCIQHSLFDFRRLTFCLQYFGESFPKSQCHRTCDNCQNDLSSVEKDVTQEAQWIVELGLYFRECVIARLCELTCSKNSTRHSN